MAMQKNEVFVEVNGSNEQNGPTIDTVWVFKQKTNVDGSPLYKARLCARGFKEGRNHEIFSTYAPVIKFDVVRALLIYAVQNRKYVIHVDFSNAYLNSPMKRKLYIKIQGISGLFLLLKELYGLETAAKSWYDTLLEELKRLGFEVSQVDACIFVNVNEELIIITYVDDMLVIGSDAIKINCFVEKLRFKVKNLGMVQRFLGIDMTYDYEQQCMELSQEQYVISSLKEIGLDDCNPVGTPLHYLLRNPYSINFHLDMDVLKWT